MKKVIILLFSIFFSMCFLSSCEDGVVLNGAVLDSNTIIIPPHAGWKILKASNLSRSVEIEYEDSIGYHFSVLYCKFGFGFGENKILVSTIKLPNGIIIDKYGKEILFP